MKSSYSFQDVEILLKDISGQVEPLSTEVREKNIQAGQHYCEMIPLEYKPSQKYMKAYQNALNHYAFKTALATSILAEKMYLAKGENLTIVSLARAGIPIGILIRRYLKNKYRVNVKHYAISIIRDRGIDKNALNYILNYRKPESILFVDGWIGKGTILRQLKEAVKSYPGLEANLGVVSDPANLTDLCGTHEDILIPSSCLNATVTGLISRTFLRNDIIKPRDFHGAIFYSELLSEDLSEQFLQTIEKEFVYNNTHLENSISGNGNGMEVVKKVAKEYKIDNINFIKPGIGETTRVLLRRIPWKIIVNENYINVDELKHIYQLASEKNIPCEVSRIELNNYKVCGIIRQLSDV